MNTKRIFATLLVATVLGGTVLIAKPSKKYQEWAEGPVKFLMTNQEERDWSRVQTDAQAERFVEVFWARRDPTPQTPVNEFRQRFDQLVELADDRFTAGRVRGALSDRGKVLILVGPPTRIVRNQAEPNLNIQTPTPFGQADPNAGKVPTETWVWENKDIPPFAGVKELEIVFVDQSSTNNYRLGQAVKVAPTEIMNRALAHYLVSPNLTEVPDYSQLAPAAVQEVTIPATEIKTSFESDALASAYRDFRAAKESPYKNVYLTYGEYITSDGDYFVPVQIYMPKNEQVTADTKLSFFGVVEKKDGEVVVVYEEPITVMASKEAVFVDKSLRLEPGDYVGTFGLAVDEKPVAVAKTDLKLAGLEKDSSGASGLILSNNVYPLSEAQAPTDPFAFGGIKVVPKGDRTFLKSEEMWYFFEIRNPGLDPATNQPKVQVSIDVEGPTIDGKKIRMRSPLTEAAAQELKGVPGHYAVGSAIPLSSFPAGNYTISLKVLDTVNKQTYNLKESFKVVE